MLTFSKTQYNNYQYHKFKNRYDNGHVYDLAHASMPDWSTFQMLPSWVSSLFHHQMLD